MHEEEGEDLGSVVKTFHARSSNEEEKHWSFVEGYYCQPATELLGELLLLPT